MNENNSPILPVSEEELKLSLPKIPRNVKRKMQREAEKLEKRQEMNNLVNKEYSNGPFNNKYQIRSVAYATESSALYIIPSGFVNYFHVIFEDGESVNIKANFMTKEQIEEEFGINTLEDYSQLRGGLK